LTNILSGKWRESTFITICAARSGGMGITMDAKLFSDYQKEIADIILGLTSLYDKDCSNIILYGSAALNKLSYKKINDKYEFYSDIEFLVVPKDRKNENSKDFRKELINRSFDFLKGFSNLETIPFVDVYPVSESFFSNGELRISTFELKHNGKNLKGNDLLDLLPDVNKDNYNLKIQNVEIVKALKIMVLESYNWFLCKDNYSEKEEYHFCYFLSSAFLNILRTLLPIFGYFKLTTEERVNLISVLKKDLQITTYFPEYTLNQFEEVLKEKDGCHFYRNPRELFSLSFAGYKSLLCLLLNSNEDLLISELKNNKNNIFSGTELKIEQLSLLTCFFISALSCIDNLINHNGISDVDIERLTKFFDELIAGANAYKLMNIINKYGELERKRWKIIGSKD